ncbi:MAG TPA: hypothetical protein VGQ35_10055 [Dongiaceae bacterium]|jgi:hypothetical protein|nr:hypothetical protein [Dongiaceae bacterium]
MSYDPNIPNAPRGGGSSALYFIVGGLVVLAGVFVFLYTNDYIGGGSHDVDVNIQAPASNEPAAPAPAPAPAPEGNTGGTTNSQ